MSGEFEDIDIKDYQLKVFDGKLKTITGTTNVPFKPFCVTDGNKEKTIQIFFLTEKKTAFITDFCYEKYKEQIDTYFAGKTEKFKTDTNNPFDAILDNIAENGLTIEHLKKLEQDLSYIDLLQPDIYTAIKKKPKSRLALAKYLDFTDKRNYELLNTYDIYDILWILTNNVYGYKELDAVTENVSICVSILHNRKLDAKEWRYISTLVKSKREDNNNYYRFLYSLSYIDPYFVESILTEIYEEKKTEKIRKYLLELHSEYLFKEQFDAMKNSENPADRIQNVISLLRSYPDKRVVIANEAIQLNDVTLLFAVKKFAEQAKLSEVIEIIKKEIAHKRDISLYKPFVICPSDGNIIHCSKTTILRNSNGRVYIIPIYECSTCSRRYTISTNWKDYESIHIKGGKLLNLLMDPKKISKNRPDVIIDPYIDSRANGKSIYKRFKKDYSPKKCIVYKGNSYTKKCIICKHSKLVDGRCVLISKDMHRHVVPIRMCPICGLVYIRYENYIEDEDAFSCENKDDLIRFQSLYNSKTESKAEKERNKSPDNKDATIKTSAIKIIKPEENNKKTNGLDLYKNDVKKQKRKESDGKTIKVEDFVVRRDVFKCMNKDHVLANVNASIGIINKDGKVIQTTVSAGYCKECNTFFILESTFQKLKIKGTPICRITDQKTYMKGKANINGMKLASESLLMQYGYNVSQSEGLTSARRHKILAILIDNSIMTKSEIISYIDFFISQKQSLDKYEKAIEKWNNDRDFVEEYKAGRYTTIGVSGIYH